MSDAMPDPMADMAPADLEDARVAAAGVMARLLACEAKIAATQARQYAIDAQIAQMRRDVDRLAADAAGEF